MVPPCLEVRRALRGKDPGRLRYPPGPVDNGVYKFCGKRCGVVGVAAIAGPRNECVGSLGSAQAAVPCRKLESSTGRALCRRRSGLWPRAIELPALGRGPGAILKFQVICSRF